MGVAEGRSASGEERERQIVQVLLDAFEDLIRDDPHAFRRKFRKMAADPFSFYRGSACLFYSDQTLVEVQTEDAIANAVGDEDEGFAGYLADLGAAYGSQVREDHHLFVDAFRNGAIPGLPAG